MLLFSGDEADSGEKEREVRQDPLDGPGLTGRVGTRERAGARGAGGSQGSGREPGERVGTRGAGASQGRGRETKSHDGVGGMCCELQQSAWDQVLTRVGVNRSVVLRQTKTWRRECVVSLGCVGGELSLGSKGGRVELFHSA